MKILICFLSLFCCTYLSAQTTKTVVVKAGKNVNEFLAASDMFYYPSFKNGTVFFKDGTKGSARLNYNLLMDEINFIDAKGDTLDLATDVKETIDVISVANDSFYYNQGYVMHIAGNNAFKLAVRQVWTTSEKSKTGIYNSQSLSSSTVPLASLFVYGKNHDLISNEDLELTKVKHYYFGDKHNRFILAGKKNLLKLFPDQENTIDSYLKNNKVDFTNVEHLQKIVALLIKS